MGLRFRKSIKIAPGVKLNLGKKSSSVTFGKKGLHYTVSSTGRKTKTVSIPGTGISYSKTSESGSKKKSAPRSTNASSSPQKPRGNGGKKWYQKTGWIILLLILFFPVGLFLMWKYTDWGKKVKGIITVLILCIAVYGATIPSNENPDNNAIPIQSATSTPVPTVTQEPTPSPTPEPTPTPTPEPTPTPAATSTPIPVVEENTDPIVYITNTGEKYHLGNCRTLKDSRIEKTLSSVINSYEPCGICHPPTK